MTPGIELALEAVDPAAAGLRSVGATSVKKKANVYKPINSILFCASSFELWVSSGMKDFMPHVYLTLRAQTLLLKHFLSKCCLYLLDNGCVKCNISANWHSPCPEVLSSHK